jgi:hypothetical protein
VLAACGSSRQHNRQQGVSCWGQTAVDRSIENHPFPVTQGGRAGGCAHLQGEAGQLPVGGCQAPGLQPGGGAALGGLCGQHFVLYVGEKETGTEGEEEEDRRMLLLVMM